MKSGEVVERFPLDMTMGEIRCELFPHLTYHNKERWRVNDVLVSSGDLLCDVLVGELRQKMMVYGEVREFSLRLRSEEEILLAFERTGYHRGLTVGGLPMVVRETNLKNIYSWVVTVSGAEVSTPWGCQSTEMGEAVYNRIWDTAHLLMVPEPPPDHSDMEVFVHILLGGGMVKVVPDPQWIF